MPLHRRVWSRPRRPDDHAGPAARRTKRAVAGAARRATGTTSPIRAPRAGRNPSRHMVDAPRRAIATFWSTSDCPSLTKPSIGGAGDGDQGAATACSSTRPISSSTRSRATPCRRMHGTRCDRDPDARDFAVFLDQNFAPQKRLRHAQAPVPARLRRLAGLLQARRIAAAGRMVEALFRLARPRQSAARSSRQRHRLICVPGRGRDGRSRSIWWRSRWA